MVKPYAMKTACVSLFSFLFTLLIAGCSSSEKSSDADSLVVLTDSVVEEPTSKEKVFWTKGVFSEHDVMELNNPLAIFFNDSARIVDTLAFQKALGKEVEIVKLDSVNTEWDMTRFKMKFRQSEICLYHYYYQGSDPTLFRTEFQSAIIRDKEIKLKNGVSVGMTKREVLAKYSFIEQPSDIIYIESGYDGFLRLEFENNVLTSIEFWPQSNIRDEFGSLRIFTFLTTYNPFTIPLDANYFVSKMGTDTKVEIDTLEREVESEQGDKSKLYWYRNLVTKNNTQFDLIDFSGSKTHLTLVRAYVTTPGITFEEGVKVGMKRQDFLTRLELPTDVEIAWINFQGGKLRVEFKNDVISSLEWGNGRIGRINY